MRAPISHLHKSSMHRHGYGAWGNGGWVRWRLKESRGAPINLLWQPVLFSSFMPSQRASLIHVHSTPAPILFAPLLYAVQSLSLTQKGFCHLLSALSLTRREHIKVRLNPQEGRDQSLAIISSGMKQIDEDLRKGGGLLKDRSALGGGRGDRGVGNPKSVLQSGSCFIWTPNTVRKRDCVLKFSCSLIILLPFQKNLWMTAGERRSKKSN